MGTQSAYESADLPEHFQKPSKPHREHGESSFSARLVFKVVMWCVVAIAVLLAPMTCGGRGHEVVLLNGTHIQYDVVIGGRTYPLPARSHWPIDLSNGTHQLQMRSEHHAETMQISIHNPAPWYRRLFDDPVTVINPDGVAAIYEDQIPYGDPRDRAYREAEVTFTMHLGENVYRFGHVDFLFINAPAQLRINSRRSVEWKTALNVLDEPKIIDNLHAIEYCLGDDASLEYATRRALFEPDNDELLGVLRFRLEPAAFEALLQPYLHVRPPLVNVHRAYQDLVEREELAVDLDAMYQQLVDEFPDDAMAEYLQARMIKDVSKLKPAFERVRQMGDRYGHALHTLYLMEFTNARFEDALTLAHEMRQRDPADTHFMGHEAETLMALGQYEQAATIFQEMVRLQPFNGYAVRSFIHVLNQLDRARAAQSARTQLLRRFIDDGDPARADQWSVWFDATDLYERGDLAEAAAAFRTGGEIFNDFIAMIIEGQLDEARALLRETDTSLWMTEHLTLAVAALDAGRDDIYDDLLPALTEKEFWSGRAAEVAQWLSRDGQVRVDQLRGVPMHIDDKMLLLTLVGQLHPLHRNWCFELVRTLNFQPDFPHHLLERVTSRPTRR